MEVGVAETTANLPLPFLHLWRELRRQRHHGFADELIGGRREMRDAARRRDTGVVRNHLDAALHRALERGHQRIGIVRRNGDRIDALRDQRIEHFDLPFRGRASWGR